MIRRISSLIGSFLPSLPVGGQGLEIQCEPGKGDSKSTIAHLPPYPALSIAVGFAMPVQLPPPHFHAVASVPLFIVHRSCISCAARLVTRPVPKQPSHWTTRTL